MKAVKIPWRHHVICILAPNLVGAKLASIGIPWWQAGISASLLMILMVLVGLILLPRVPLPPDIQK